MRSASFFAFLKRDSRLLSFHLSLIGHSSFKGLNQIKSCQVVHKMVRKPAPNLSDNDNQNKKEVSERATPLADAKLSAKILELVSKAASLKQVHPTFEYFSVSLPIE